MQTQHIRSQATHHTQPVITNLYLEGIKGRVMKIASSAEKWLLVILIKKKEAFFVCSK